MIDDPAGLFGGETRIGFLDVCDVAQPGGEHAFIAKVKAPGGAGVYTAQLRMVEEGAEFFGETISITVAVGPAVNGAEGWGDYD